MANSTAAALIPAIALSVLPAWPQKPEAPAAAADGYLDAAACARCHAAIAGTWARTGMARSFGANPPAGLFPGGEFAHSSSGQRFSMSRREGGAFVQRRTEWPGETREARADYWIGSGDRGRGFLHRGAGGKLILLPVTWYSARGGHWGMNPGYDRALHQGFSRPVDYRCLSCHAGYPDVPPGADLSRSQARLPGRIVQGIDCQRCHGPGHAHAEAAAAGRSAADIRNAIVNPARLPAGRRIEVCLQCHLETTSAPLPNEIVRFDRGIFSYRPGQPLGDYLVSFDYPKGSAHDGRYEFVSSAYRLMQSRCFTESRGALTCTSCHDPHDIPRPGTAVSRYAAACAKCHTALPAAHPPGGDCMSCHMPQRTPSDAIRIRTTDHLIRKTPAPESRPPESEHDTPPYRGELVQFFPAQPDELYLAVAHVTQQAALETGAPRLDDLISRLRPAHGEFYLQSGNAWANLGRMDRARARLREAVERMPRNWRPLVLLGNVSSDSSMLEAAARLAPAESSPLAELGRLHAANGRHAEAAAAFQRALRIEPDSAETLIRLATSHAALGDGDAAERALREAVRLRPEFPPARVNLASLLLVKGARTEARRHFEFVLRLDPSNAAARKALAR